MTRTTDEHALQGMLDEYEELSRELSGQLGRASGAAMRSLMEERLDALWRCIEDHGADIDRRANEEPDTMANLGVSY